MIDLTKTYRTKYGNKVVLYDNVSEKYKSSYPIIGAYEYISSDGETAIAVSRWTIDGKTYVAGESTGFDLVEVTPFGDFKINDVIKVSNSSHLDKTYLIRHFAGISKNNKVTTFPAGRSQFTYDGKVKLEYWTFAEKIETE
jgi:hypothetical protein